MNMASLLGWISSFILLLTLLAQLHRQWKERSALGVSKLLFVGQLAAQVGFSVYSFLLDNDVFLFTNLVLVFVSLSGVYLTYKFKNEANSNSSENSRTVKEGKSHVEYVIYLPEGSDSLYSSIKKEIVDKFGGITEHRQNMEGLWKMDSAIIKDNIRIWTVLSDQTSKADRYFLYLKKNLEQELGEQEILVTKRNVSWL